jgi:hypothetical protein
MMEEIDESLNDMERQIAEQKALLEEMEEVKTVIKSMRDRKV